MKRGSFQPSVQVYDPGLGDLVMGDSTIGQIDGATGRLWYRGYAIEDLAQHASFEEVSHLVLAGDLPDALELAAWRAVLSTSRPLPERVLEAIAALPDGHDPFEAFTTALCVAASFAPDRDARDSDARLVQAARILSWTAGLAAACIRKHGGLDPVPVRDDLHHVAHFLWQATGREPDEMATRALETTMIVQAEHGVHAAALAALVVAAAGADLDSAVLAGVGALSGSLHGGANREAFRMVIARESPEEARAWARARIEEKYRFPGYGHRVYKSRDPRATLMAPHARRLLSRAGRTGEWERFEAMREEIETALGPRGIYANVDALSGFVYEPVGLPKAAFTIPFCLAIQTGWMAHCIEYLEDGGPVIEPGSIYLADPT